MPTPSKYENCRFAKRVSLPNSGPRVETIVDRPETRLEDVRVNLRRREIGVAEHQLNRAQVGAALEQVRGERVPQHVRAERARQVAPPRVALEDLPEADAAQRSAAGIQKEA